MSTDEIAKCLLQLERANELIRCQAEELQRSRREIDCISIENELLRDRLSKQEQICSDQEFVVEELTKQFSDVRMQNNELVQQYACLHHKFKEHDTIVQNLADTIQKEDGDAKTNQSDCVTTELTRLHKFLEESQKDLDREREQGEIFSKQLNDSRQQLQASEQRTGELSQELQLCNKALAEKESQVENLQEQLVNNETLLDEVNWRLQELELLLKQEEDQRSQLSKTNEALKKANQKHVQNIVVLNAKLEAQGADLRATKRQLQETIRQNDLNI